MNIRDLFERDIFRSINGVVKADQLDESSVWQELDEFVVTRELTRHIRSLVDALVATLDGRAEGANTNGIWISGFFGSGKSHLMKVLSYVLENREHVFGDERRLAIDFFEDKFEDAMLFGDLKRLALAKFDPILFNVDVKADQKFERSVLLQTFLKVLNEKEGYSSDHLYIADIERHLDRKGLLQRFEDEFAAKVGSPWTTERDAWAFHRDEVVGALEEVLGQSRESVEKLVDDAENNFSLTIENFARWVNEYLDKPTTGDQVMFLADEVGQFIGKDTHLMLSLQTITEQLGTVCGGRAWVLVTSQEDLDSVLGEMKSPKHADFSKIQGRFKTRLSLSSANIDEVIKERLLKKRESALSPLATAYEGKHDILRNQLSFRNAGKTYKAYEDLGDFQESYPFAAYQFELVQQVFESIRKAGATGVSLSQGERSTLDAFQNAAKQVGDRLVDVLVPFYRFYPSVEGFLDTTIKRTIDQAAENYALQAADVLILKTLFLIRYIDEMPGSVDNLVTLCIDEIDADRLALRKQVEESLERLERETLVSRNGDLYFFLTNEERDVGREIKRTTIASGAEERELGKLLFEDVLGDLRKHSYSETRKDFEFNRLSDDFPVGQKQEGHIEVAFVTPLGDSYDMYTDDGRCSLATDSAHGRVLIRLPNDPALGRELRAYLQTEAYVKAEHGSSITETKKRILRDRSEDNRERRQRLVFALGTLLADAAFFTCGQKLEINRTEPKAALSDALEYLIRNAFPKMALIGYLHPEPRAEVQRILRANDVDQVNLTLETGDANLGALNDLREYLRLSSVTSKQVVLYDLINSRYNGRPYGWPELEVVLLVARLVVLKEIDLVADGAPLPLDKAYDYLTSAQRQRRVTIRLRETASSEQLKQAQRICKELFGQLGGTSEEALYSFAKQQLTQWSDDLSTYQSIADGGNYPGAAEIQTGLDVLRRFVDERDSLRFLRRFVENGQELQDLATDVQELQGFYRNQRHAWETLRVVVNELELNRFQIEKHAEAGPAYRRLVEILETPRPYDLLSEVARLTHIAQSANEGLLKDARELVLARIDSGLGEISELLSAANADQQLRDISTQELRRIRDDVVGQKSLAHIEQAGRTADDAYDRALAAIQLAGQTSQNETTPLPIKKRQIIEPRTIAGSKSITTDEEMEKFLQLLREAIERFLASGDRVEIR